MTQSLLERVRGKTILEAKLTRRAYRRFQQEMRFGKLTLQKTPILFANSFPKSGTHLLTQILRGFSQIGPAVDSGLPAITTFEGASGRQRGEADILSDLWRLQPGDTAFGHLHAFPKVVAYLCQSGLATYFLLRDPRDVVVSHVYFVTDMYTNHAHHQYYKEELRDFDERLMVSILGRPELENPFPNIYQRFEPYLGWLNKPNVLVLRFENFINDMTTTISRVLYHAINCGFPIAVDRNVAIEILIGGVDPKRSPTFRQGKVGSWRNNFTNEHKHVFKEIAGDLLLQLGYEEDNDW